ncbi:MAG: hypothetical protein H0W39_06385 [Sphingomonas sp.]|nr:hypothetical protein [Sphingomonas sp.]
MIPLASNLALKLVAGLCALLALALLVNDRNRWKATASLRQQQVAAEAAAHAATVANYRAASDRAREADAANAARVKAEQGAISERTENDYESRIAAARAHHERLQRQARSTADSGTGGAAPVPGLPASPRAAAQGSGQGRLPHPEALIATEQAIQLDELIKWVRAQAGVTVSGGQ